VLADINGNGYADFKIELKNTCGLTLTSEDFIGVGVNIAPVAVDGSAQDGEDTQFTGQLSASDAEDDALEFSLVGGPANGTVVLNADGSFSYTPNANFNGEDSFTYKVNDGSSDSNVATVTLTVDPVNDAPVASADSTSTDEDHAVSDSVVGLGSDVDGDALTFSLAEPAPAGLIFDANGDYTFTPGDEFASLDDGEHQDVTFQYVAHDGTVASAPATVTITINGANDAPVAQAASDMTDEDSILNGKQLMADDIDVENLSFHLVSVNGAPEDSVQVHPSGTYQFDPRGLFDFLADGASTEVSFEYVANDGTVDSAPATATITIIGVNDAPMLRLASAAPIAVDDAADASLSIGGASGNVLTDSPTFDTDPDLGDQAGLTVNSIQGGEVDDVVFGEFGHIVMGANGAWGYTLTNAPTESEDEVFHYTVMDTHGATDSATLTIHVPGTGISSTSGTSGTEVVAVVDAQSTPTEDVSPEGDSVSGGGNTGNGNSYSYGSNSAPVALADEVVWDDAGLFGNVLANDSDPDAGDSLFVAAVNDNPVDGDAFVMGEYGFLMITSTGDWTYGLNGAGTDALARGESVDDVFGYTAQDDSGATAMSTLTVHVTDADFVI
jgi:VCBS repeat-containing protein